MQAIIDKLKDEAATLEGCIAGERAAAETHRDEAVRAEQNAARAEEDLTAVEAAIAVLGGKEKRRLLRKK